MKFNFHTAYTEAGFFKCSPSGPGGFRLKNSKIIKDLVYFGPVLVWLIQSCLSNPSKQCVSVADKQVRWTEVTACTCSFVKSNNSAMSREDGKA